MLTSETSHALFKGNSLRTIVWLRLLLLLTNSVHAESISGRDVRIADGDTPTVLDVERQQHKVRLAGIDAPERAQPFGNVSRQHLARLVFQKDV